MSLTVLARTLATHEPGQDAKARGLLRLATGFRCTCLARKLHFRFCRPLIKVCVAVQLYEVNLGYC